MDLANVDPRAEGPSRAGKDPNPKLGIGVELEKRIPELFSQLIVHRVENARAVELDIANMPFCLEKDRLVLPSIRAYNRVSHAISNDTGRVYLSALENGAALLDERPRRFTSVLR